MQFSVKIWVVEHAVLSHFPSVIKETPAGQGRGFLVFSGVSHKLVHPMLA